MDLISMADCITDLWCLARRDRWKWENEKSRNCKPMARFVQADLRLVNRCIERGRALNSYIQKLSEPAFSIFVS